MFSMIMGKKHFLYIYKVMSSMISVWGRLSFRQLLATIVICQILFRISCSDRPSMLHSQSLPEDTENWLLTFLSLNWRSGGVGLGYQFLVKLVWVDGEVFSPLNLETGLLVVISPFHFLRRFCQNYQRLYGCLRQQVGDQCSLKGWLVPS